LQNPACCRPSIARFAASTVSKMPTSSGRSTLAVAVVAMVELADSADFKRVIALPRFAINQVIGTFRANLAVTDRLATISGGLAQIASSRLFSGRSGLFRCAPRQNAAVPRAKCLQSTENPSRHVYCISNARRECGARLHCKWSSSGLRVRDNMNDQQDSPDLCGARERAAEIRRHWSPMERRRREGLPPDTPWALFRTFFPADRQAMNHGFGSAGRRWQPAPAFVRR
jgi:hypothetical protein